MAGNAPSCSGHSGASDVANGSAAPGKLPMLRKTNETTYCASTPSGYWLNMMSRSPRAAPKAQCRDARSIPRPPAVPPSTHLNGDLLFHTTLNSMPVVFQSCEIPRPPPSNPSRAMVFSSRYTTMNKSRLDPHACWIKDQLRAGVRLTQIHRDLEQVHGCKVVLETVRKWCIGQQKAGQIKPLRRGRPPKVSASGLDFLSGDLASGVNPASIPTWLSALLKPRGLQLVGRLVRDEIGIRGTSIDAIAAWASKQGKGRVARLSDTEFCLLACLIQTDSGIPLGRPANEIDAWIKRLVARAAEIKAAVRQQIKATGNVPQRH